MKKFLFLSAFFAVFFAARAAALPENSCERAWIDAFDRVSAEMTDVELPPFLSQNKIAGADLWAAYRRLSLRHECLLKAVCGVATGGKLPDELLATKNVFGGVAPGDFAECSTDDGSPIFEMTFEKYLKSAGIDFSEISRKCAVSPLFDRRDEQILRAEKCNFHRQISVKIFDQMLENEILKDVNRKRVGFLFKKIAEIRENLAKIRENLETFIAFANAQFGQMCAVSQKVK